MFPFENLVKLRLTRKRFEHCLNVAKASRWLAIKYGADEKKALIAGILHDITKEWSTSDHMKFLHNYNIGITRFEFASKKLLHAITGSCYAKIFLKVTDRDILNSIRFHTTARSGMSILEKVIYLADFISDDRSFSGVNRLRTLAALNLDDAVFAGIMDTIEELLKKKSIIHPDTLSAYNEFVINYDQSKGIKFEKFFLSSGRKINRFNVHALA